MSELIFGKDEVTIRTRIRAPLVGETVHEEKVPYSKLQAQGLRLTITSIDRTLDDNGFLSAISLKTADIESDAEFYTPKDEVELPLTPAALMYGYISTSRENRRFFPGFKVPFTLRDGDREYSVHVTGGSQDAHTGDPSEGTQIVGGLKPFFVEHNSTAQGRVRIRAVDPGKNYSLTYME